MHLDMLYIAKRNIKTLDRKNDVWLLIELGAFFLVTLVKGLSIKLY